MTLLQYQTNNDSISTHNTADVTWVSSCVAVDTDVHKTVQHERSKYCEVVQVGARQPDYPAIVRINNNNNLL